MTTNDTFRASRRPFWAALVVVAGLHWAIRLIPVRWDSPDSVKTARQSEPVEVWNRNDRRDLSPTVTQRSVDRPDLADKPARFGGEFKNRVDVETRAPRYGRLVPAPPTGESPESDDEGMRRLMPNGGASPHLLPDDIATGSETVLNTDPVMHASFMNRIADEIWDAWNGHVQDALRELSRKKRDLEDNYVTRIQVTLNEQGEVSAIRIVKQSGELLIDAAPGKAFRRVGRFPNPPSQLVGKDGFVRFEYSFTVLLKRGIFSILPFTA